MLKFVAATTLITLLFAPPCWAQRPLSANQLPKSGVVSYAGTFIGQDFTAPMSLTVDFGAGTVSADLTIPELFPGTSTESAPQHYTPTGTIDTDGGFLATGGPSGGGVFGFGGLIGSQSVIVLAGNFLVGQARTAAGEFIAQFCFENCSAIRTRSGTFSATRAQ